MFRKFLKNAAKSNFKTRSRRYYSSSNHQQNYKKTAPSGDFEYQFNPDPFVQQFLHRQDEENEPILEPIEPIEYPPEPTEKPIDETPQIPEETYIEPIPLAAEVPESPEIQLPTVLQTYHKEVKDIADKVKDAMCMIRVYDKCRAVAHGSGCFIESDGVVVTAAHVVGSQKTVAVITRDKPDTMLRASVLLVDQFSDIAILKVNPPRGVLDPAPFNFKTVKLADRDYELKEGDFCMAIGAPQSTRYFGSTSTGIINCVPRKLGDLWEKVVIQHTAMCGGGLSGAPLLNAQGDIIGVHILGTRSARSSGTPFGFAAPLGEVYHLYDQFKQSTSKYEIGIVYCEVESETHGKHWYVTNSTNKDVKKGDRILSVVGIEGKNQNTLAGVIKESVYQGNPIELRIERIIVQDGKPVTQIKTVKVVPNMKLKKI